jgi:hypothetical protein
MYYKTLANIKDNLILDKIENNQMNFIFKKILLKKLTCIN